MTYDLFAKHLTPSAQARLLVLSVLLLWTTLTVQAELNRHGPIDNSVTVFDEPPAYLHPRTAIGFDLTGLPARQDGVEAALRASAHQLDGLEARAHTHMSLAVYYKLHGQMSRAVAEKKKGDYWLRVSRYSDQ